MKAPHLGLAAAPSRRAEGRDHGRSVLVHDPERDGAGFRRGGMASGAGAGEQRLAGLAHGRAGPRQTAASTEAVHPAYQG